jgi:hypothetical protein
MHINAVRPFDLKMELDRLPFSAAESDPTSGMSMNANFERLPAFEATTDG